MSYDHVPNLKPKLTHPTIRLAVITESLEDDDFIGSKPLLGPAGRFLHAHLANIDPTFSTDQVFFGSLFQAQTPYNLDTLSWEGTEFAARLAQLAADLHEFRPNCLLLLGRTAFRAFRPDLCTPTKSGWSIPLADWRGSPIQTTGCYQCKAIATYHPSHIFACYSDVPYFGIDIAKAVRHAAYPELRLLERHPVLHPSFDYVIQQLQLIRLRHTPIAFDVEGYPDDVGITMVSICTSPTEGFVIPFCDETRGTHYWSEEEETAVWHELALVLSDPLVPKAAHQCFYETFMFAWRHKCVIANLNDDTMMKQWEFAPELERSLAVATSCHTDEPFYKNQRTDANINTRLSYNFTDSAVTVEINSVLERCLLKTPKSYEHYRFNIRLIPPYTYLHLRGCRLDTDKIEELKTTITNEINTLNAQIEVDLGREFNVKSVNDKRWLLYDHLKYRPSTKYGHTTKEDILLKYWSKYQNPIVRQIIQCVRKRTRLSDINKLVPYTDGRIRSSYDLVNTNTGRTSSKQSLALRVVLDKNGNPVWESTGTNLQNVTEELRIAFTADSPHHEFAQHDLSGADGWTVGADLAALGHPTMLEDYHAGIKPAKVLLFMLKEVEAGRDPLAVNFLPRPELAQKLKALKTDEDDGSGRPKGWRYLCCKRCQHGTNYDMHEDRLAELIFSDSDAAIALTPQEARTYQRLYCSRYNPKARNEWIARELATKGCLIAACGIKRQFFNIRNRFNITSDIIREASAFEPQANTTWAANKALENLWYDPTNRNSQGGLFVEPLIQIHDAIATQYHSRYAEWARAKLDSWFLNPLTIHGIQLTIPVVGKYGNNWGELE